MSRFKLSLIFLFLLFGLLSGIGGYTFIYAKGFSYLSTDPRACANCHVMQEHFDSWEKSSHHANATCADCHMPHGFFGKYYTKAENGYLHSKAFTLQNFANPIQIRESSLKVLNKSCLHCHSGTVSNIAEHNADKNEVRTCSRCHAGVGH